MEGEGKFETVGSLYPSNFPSNFHGCIVNLSTQIKGQFEDDIYSHYFLTHNITRNYVNDIFTALLT